MPLHIAEYDQIGLDSQNQLAQAAQQPAITTQEILVGSASAEFNDRTKLVELYFTEDMHINFGKPGNAATTDMLYTAGERIYFTLIGRGFSVDTATP